MQTINGYYGQDGVMSDGWQSEAEAIAEFEAHYQGAEFEGCFVTELDGRFVIAY